MQQATCGKWLPNTEQLKAHENDCCECLRARLTGTDTMAAALSWLHSAVAKYAAFHGPSCDKHDELTVGCPECEIDVELNMTFGEAMGVDKSLKSRDAKQYKCGAVDALNRLLEITEGGPHMIWRESVSSLRDHIAATGEIGA